MTTEDRPWKSQDCWAHLERLGFLWIKCWRTLPPPISFRNVFSGLRWAPERQALRAVGAACLLTANPMAVRVCGVGIECTVTGTPEFSTILKVVRALGLRLHASTEHHLT